MKEFGDDEIDYEKLTQNPYLDAVVNECLRLGSNFIFQIRTAVVVSVLIKKKKLF